MGGNVLQLEQVYSTVSDWDEIILADMITKEAAITTGADR